SIPSGGLALTLLPVARSPEFLPAARHAASLSGQSSATGRLMASAINSLPAIVLRVPETCLDTHGPDFLAFSASCGLQSRPRMDTSAPLILSGVHFVFVCVVSMPTFVTRVTFWRKQKVDRKVIIF
ncbi:MAG: hypothetical protein OEV73_00005, partial [Desulfobulbaceae bacterium]|nr:hypothetical protein [Desulfobulbaceae bacterium]